VYFVPIMQKVQTGQVIEFYSNSCLVKTKFGKFDCVATKNVVVGDFVEVEIIQDSKKPLGKIIKVNRRDSKISKRIKNQDKLFAANISHVGILVTQIPKTSSEFIDKWLVKANASNIKPFLINNKVDMKQEKNYLEKLDIYKNINIKIIDTSAKYDKNISELKEFLTDKCVLFVGNSGAGKSTLTSKIIGKNLKISSLSNDQGVHTTSVSSLYEIDSNIKIIDSPGMRDIAIENYSEKEIINGFEEIQNASKYCKFNNCNHIDNEGCNITKKLLNDEINESRYNNFIKFLNIK
tara:strand:+ start:1015 stop:1893 length:879 start_codon:yes stop_codon:yes gene_type:complete